MKTSLFSILLIFIIISCNHSGDEDISLFMDYFYTSQSIDIIDSDDYLVGQIISVQRYNDSLLVFLDYFRRGIYLLNENTLSIEEIGDYGRGPGEYIQPAYFNITDDGLIVFSDDTNTLIKGIDLSGKSMFTITGRVGALKLLPIQKDIYTFRQPRHALIHYSRDGAELGEYIPLTYEEGELYGRIHGGGLFSYNNLIYLMKSTSKTIYVYDTKSNILTTLEPLALQDVNIEYSFENNRISYEGDIIIYFNNLMIEDDLHFVVGVKKAYSDIYSIRILRQDGSILAEHKTNHIIAGNSHNEVYFIENISENNNYYNILNIYEYKY